MEKDHLNNIFFVLNSFYPLIWQFIRYFAFGKLRQLNQFRISVRMKNFKSIVFSNKM